MNETAEQGPDYENCWNESSISGHEKGALEELEIHSDNLIIQNCP